MSRTAASNGAGEFTFTFLATGSYTVRVEAPGFNTFASTGVTLSAGVTNRVDAKLQTGNVSQTVEVLASAAILQSDSDTVGTTVAEKQVQIYLSTWESNAYIQDDWHVAQNSP